MFCQFVLKTQMWDKRDCGRTKQAGLSASLPFTENSTAPSFQNWSKNSNPNLKKILTRVHSKNSRNLTEVKVESSVTLLTKNVVTPCPMSPYIYVMLTLRYCFHV